MTCEAFLDRLYDDDARASQRGRAAVPTDLAQHMLACQVCRAAYESARADERLLTRALVDAPPQAWQADVLRHMARRRRRVGWTRRIATVNDVVTWGTLALAGSHILMGGSPAPVHVAAFLTGGAAVFLLPRLGKRWMIPLRRPFRLV